MERLTYRDNSGRALLTHFGKQMYCSTQAIADCVCKLEERFEDAIFLLKEQEQEISRLKHHVDCDAAEKLPCGCVGYGRGYNDDEPCETCKACEKYNGYGEE